MTYFVLMVAVIVLMLVGFYAARFMDKETTDRYGNTTKTNAGTATKAAALGIGALLLVIITACGSYAQVENGHVGMLKSFGALQDTPLDAGPHFKEPWATVDEVSIQVETRTYRMNDGENGIGSAVSSDNQAVFMDVVVDYQLLEGSAVDVYRTIGPQFVEKKLDPAVPELTKRVTAGYKAVDFAKNRAEIRTKIEEALTAEMSTVGLRVNKVSLRNVDFTDSFSAAIERTVEAEQNAKAATEQVKIKEAEAKQAEAVAKGQAAAAIATAKGEADATTLRARAEANRIRLEGQALAQNPAVLRLRSIEKLNPTIQTLVVPDDSTIVQGLDGRTVVNP